MITDPKWGIVPLPFDSFRDGQEEIIDSIYERFQSGCKVVFLQAPTGVGKSIIGEGTRRLVRGNGIYSCSTKTLQDQFVSDFVYGRVIKGRSNYLTLAGSLDRMGRKSSSGPSMVTCADCTYTRESGCRWCVSQTGCPYVMARNSAAQAELAILNTSYFLTDANKGMGRFKDRDLVIIDEADLLEGELLNQVEVFVSDRRMAKMNIDPPTRKTVESAWLPWVEEEAIPKVARYIESLKVPHDPDASAADIKEYSSLRDLSERLDILKRELPKGGWVYDGYDSGHTIFRPVEVNEWGSKYLWPHAQRFLLMSATILSASHMADQLGLTDKWDVIDVDSNFPVENRPVYVVPIADMTYKLKDEEWPKMVDGISGVLRRHPDERILVHCVSYQLARYIKDELKLRSSEWSRRDIIIYENSNEKDTALSRFKSRPGAVILAASMDRGIDLADDYCRVQVIAKIPFGNTKDKRIIARMKQTKGGYTWYKMEAIRTLIQMTGRGVRSKEDWCTTYILDKQFTSNIMASKYLLPKWWKAALRMDLGPRKLLGG